MRTHHTPDYPETPENLAHIQLGIPPASSAESLLEISNKALLGGLLVLLLIAFSWFFSQSEALRQSLFLQSAEIAQSPLLYQAILVGLLAQLIDGALGMAYGVSATSFLVSIGASPAAASGAVHISEIFTTAFSGVSHIKFGNVDKALFKRLVIPGVLGGILGAYVLTSIDGKLIKPFVTVYLLVMGLLILSKAFAKKTAQKHDVRHIKTLAVSGGFLDAVGGGGWGPIVTSTLIGRGNNPRRTIGSVNTAEFFVALATGITFLFLGTITHWVFIAGLIIGGLFAAPFAAYLTSRFTTRNLMLTVGLLITGLSIYNTYQAVLSFSTK
jgi:uncharacterized membrane protein YfcA